MSSPSTRNVRFVPREKTPEQRDAVALPVSFDGGPSDPADVARRYLDQVFNLDVEERGVSFGPDADPPPTTTLSNVQPSALTDTEVVRFSQTVASIPVFGSHIVVEVGKDQRLVAVDADVASVREVSPVATLDAQAAAAKVAAFTGADLSAIKSDVEPSLVFYLDESDAPRWHLAWLLVDIAATPAEFREAHPHKGHKSSPRRRHARLDYLVDAHDGEVLFYYSLTPGARAAHGPPAIPVKCRGLDVLGAPQEFYGVAAPGGFELFDPLQRVRTVDMRGGDTSVDEPKVPADGVRHARADFADVNPAAVSAHVNVCRVLDFFRSVLKRNGVDDQGMELVSVVNCTDTGSEPPPEWGNATWWEGKMWYGQQRDAKGHLKSYAVYLDVIAHELMHGVVEHTAGLLYKNQSGALNESFADVLGLIITNWYQVGADSDVAKWTWEFLPGLGEGGKPVRDLSDPTRTGDPDHMRSFLRTREDEGGVHTNSNIHNKAAYNVLTAVDAKGERVFTPRDAAVLYYMCLVRLPQNATFDKTLRVLLDVTAMYYSGDEAVAARKVAAVRGAYAKVGIKVEG